jgi:hypothetical protein
MAADQQEHISKMKEKMCSTMQPGSKEYDKYCR